MAPTPNWQLPTAAIAAIVAIAGALLAFAFVRLTDDDDAVPAGTTPSTVVQTAPPVSTVPPVVTTPAPTATTVTTTTAPVGPAVPSTTVPGQPSATVPPAATTPQGAVTVPRRR